MSVLVETTIGDLIFDLYIEERPRCKYSLQLFIYVLFYYSLYCKVIGISYPNFIDLSSIQHASTF